MLPENFPKNAFGSTFPQRLMETKTIQEVHPVSIAALRKRLISLYRAYPRQFWLIVGASFIDGLGGALLFPFFSLYITSRFHVGMTQVGVLFAVYAVATLFGQFVGGALTDQIGRRSMIIFGLLTSAATGLALGLVGRLELFYALAFIAGLFAQAAQPAQMAMITDLLPEEQRADGFAVLRVAMNLTVAIGPAIGGFLASRSYLLLFIADAISSLIAAVAVYLYVRETRPATAATTEGGESAAPVDLWASLRGYVDVFHNRLFVAFLLLFTLTTMIYTQMYSTLAVYLRDVHGVPEAGFGILMSLNALLVVLFQFLITRRTSAYPPMVVMALGTLLYAVGFSMYGFVATYSLFLMAVVILTIGEMLIVPTARAVVANLAPEDMRGRYMAAFGLGWVVSAMIGPLGAGWIMDHYDPRWVWYATGILGLVTAAGYLLLHRALRARNSSYSRAA